MKDISRKEALKMATEILIKAEKERELLDERLFSKKAEIFSLLDGFKYKMGVALIALCIIKAMV